MDHFLRSTPIIDFHHPTVLSLAGELAVGTEDRVETTRRCFEWVRDKVRHSVDHRLNPVTCSASSVLAARTGFCYAKSHLLVALLRANGIPAGFCYQRLRSETTDAFFLHGLAAVSLPGVGWYRVDPRGNREGIDARFTPPVEQLAYAIRYPGEKDLLEVRPYPLPAVIETLESCQTYEEVLARLPDAPLPDPPSPHA
jgi:transglutaminase-like putative cysteine protease